MAPEQVTGAPLDERADLFALGVMLYEMLGGQRPFHGASTIETIQAVLSTDPPALTTLNPTVTNALATIVQRLLEKDRESRFQSAADLAWALESLRRCQPTHDMRSRHAALPRRASLRDGSPGWPPLSRCSRWRRGRVPARRPIDRFTR